MFDINKKRTDLTRQLAEEMKETAAQARICLADERFIEYRRRYQKIRATLVDAMLECAEADPIKYALEMNTYVTKIKTMGLLLGSVTDDSKFSEGEPAALVSNPGEQPGLNSNAKEAKKI
jgi:hypothetical protein